MPMNGTNENPIVYLDEDGSGPHLHVCKDAMKSVAARAQDWLDRERAFGRVPAEAVPTIERLIEDLA